jgi:hypothetical protein
MFPPIDRAINFQTAPGKGVIIISGKKYEGERIYEKKGFPGMGIYHVAFKRIAV